LFKPFAYLALFEKGYSPDTIVFDVETNFSVDENRPYIPKNYDRIFRGPVNLRNSLAQSLNIPAVKTLYLAGIDNVLELAFNFGIKTFTKGSAEYGLPLVLGGGAVTLYDMVGAYSVLSEDGVRHNQSTILKITDKDGKIIEEYQDKSKLIFNPNYIRMVNDVLSDNQARTPLFGTANNALFFGQNIDVAAKTGTSSDSRDA
jgi:membrane carboxypeptidase/penicillin-binding protein